LSNKKQEFSFKAYKAILPMLLSIAIVYFILKDVPFSLIATIKFDFVFFIFILLAMLMAVLRDANYVMRLRLLTEKKITFFKSTQIILLWEFASSITPSAFGGPLAALYLLKKEKITLGKSTSIVLITAFLDELVFIIVLPVLYLILGSKLFILNTDCIENAELVKLVPYLKNIVLGVYLFLLIVYVVLFYGLFINAKSLRHAYHILAKLPIINRWKDSLYKAGDDILLASNEAKTKSISFWVKAFSYTFLSWSARYILAFFVIAAMMHSMPDLIDVYGKLYFIRTLSILPLSPGGIGVAELSFLALLCSYMPFGLTKIATLIWRFLSYHIYLILGVILIPFYIKNKDK
jgi:uncharacterized protein (TIRG00374 family)